MTYNVSGIIKGNHSVILVNSYSLSVSCIPGTMLDGEVLDFLRLTGDHLDCQQSE